MSKFAERIALPGAYKSEAEAIKEGTALLTRLAGESPEVRAHRKRKALNQAAWRARNPAASREKAMLWRANNPYTGWENAKWRGNPWDDVEDCLIMDRAIPDRQLSLKLGRSVKAILCRRTRLKKLNAKEDLDLTRQ